MKKNPSMEKIKIRVPSQLEGNMGTKVDNNSIKKVWTNIMSLLWETQKYQESGKKNQITTTTKITRINVIITKIVIAKKMITTAEK